jgi:hypothetical protein
MKGFTMANEGMYCNLLNFKCNIYHNIWLYCKTLCPSPIEEKKND